MNSVGQWCKIEQPWKSDSGSHQHQAWGATNMKPLFDQERCEPFWIVWTTAFLFCGLWVGRLIVTPMQSKGKMLANQNSTFPPVVIFYFCFKQIVVHSVNGYASCKMVKNQTPVSLGSFINSHRLCVWFPSLPLYWMFCCYLKPKLRSLVLLWLLYSVLIMQRNHNISLASQWRIPVSPVWRNLHVAWSCHSGFSCTPFTLTPNTVDVSSGKGACSIYFYALTVPLGI